MACAARRRNVRVGLCVRRPLLTLNVVPPPTQTALLWMRWVIRVAKIIRPIGDALHIPTPHILALGVCKTAIALLGSSTDIDAVQLAVTTTFVSESQL